MESDRIEVIPDVQRASMRSHIGITSHIVVDFVLENQIVACKRFRGPHTVENIHDDLTQKIRAIVTDNAANIVKEFSLPGMEILDEADLDDDDPEGMTLYYNPSSPITSTN